jgi:hypothetical protein
VEHADHQLVHVLEAVEAACPVAVERLADPAGRQRRPVHPGAERSAGPPHDDDPDLRISRRPFGGIGEGCRQVMIEGIQHAWAGSR